MSDWGGWEAPPVALDGEDVFVGSESGTLVVNWRTGEVTTSDAVPGGYPDVHGGRAVVQDRREVRIVNARTGATILTVPTQGGYTMVRLSPDGRLATVASDPMPDTPGVDLYTVDTGAHVRVEDGDPYSSGWTALSQYYSVTQDGVLTCLSGGDPCHTQPLPDGPAARGSGPAGRRGLRKLSKFLVDPCRSPVDFWAPPAPYVVNTCPGTFRGPDERDPP